MIDIVGDDTPVAVDVWTLDATGGYEVSRVTLQAGTANASEQLAIRAIEALRSRLLETRLTLRERRKEPLVEKRAMPSAPDLTQENPKRMGIELGAAALTSLDHVGPAFLPLAQLDWAVHRSLAVQATLAGFGTRPTIATGSGRARLAQQYGLIGGRYRFGSGSELVPFITISAGVLRTSVEGYSESPREGHSLQKWSFLVDGSIGAALELGGHFSLALAAHSQLAEPYVAVHFLDETVASSGRPNLVLTLTLGAWL